MRSKADLEAELQRLTGQPVLDAILDCVGAPDLLQLGFSLLGTSGHYVDVGLLGDRVDIPLFPRINREQSFYGSNWGNYIDLSEVMALAAAGKIQHTTTPIRFEQINETLDRLREGTLVGRAVVIF